MNSTPGTTPSQAQSHYDKMADLPFQEGYVPKGDTPTLTDELFFQRAVQTYLWALPAQRLIDLR